MHAKQAVITAVGALVVATAAVAQQPMAHDTAHRAMAGHAMPARRGMGMMRGSPDAMSCGMMGEGGMGGMMHDSAMSGVMEGMMRAMMGSAEHLLGAKAQLALTADQERRLTAIRDAARTAHDAGVHDAAHHAQELDDVLKAAAPDTAALAHHFAGELAGLGQAHLAMLRSAALARAVLTDAQRRTADSLAAGMGCGMMGGHGSAAAHAH